MRDSRPAADLKMVADLGRSLLVTVHPKKVAERVADAITAGTGACRCVFTAELNNIGIITCLSGDAEAAAEDVIPRGTINSWLQFMPPHVSYCESEKDLFLVNGSDHEVEYIAPLRIDGEIRGFIAVCFESKDELTEDKMRFIDAATQMAAMSINLSAHYENALNNSITKTREEHRKFTESVLDSLPVSLYVVDRDLRIVTWNRNREIGIQGVPRDTVIGKKVFDVLAKYPHGRLRNEFERAFRTGNIERIEQQTIGDDGSTRHWLVSKVPMRDPETGEVTHVITIGEDVTVRVEATHAVGRAEKLAAVGRLAAGVVHEINNPLATISACAEALEQRIEEGAFGSCEAESDLAEYLGLIRSEAFRCKKITTGLLDFSRVRTGERSPSDLGEIVASAANLVSHQKRGDGIVIETEIEASLPSVNADAGQIQQAVISLATNAIDAMPHGGRLSFSVHTSGNRVIVDVSDTGVGIPAENMSKIFEPFFTTKDVGSGTGLGLAVCYGIISDHGGRLSVRSTEGKGTTFTITLNAARGG